MKYGMRFLVAEFPVNPSPGKSLDICHQNYILHTEVHNQQSYLIGVNSLCLDSEMKTFLCSQV